MGPTWNSPIDLCWDEWWWPLLLGGYTLGMGVRGDDKLNDTEVGVGVGMDEGLAVGGRG